MISLTAIFDLILIMLGNLVVKVLNLEGIMKDTALLVKYYQFVMHFLAIKYVEEYNLSLFVNFLSLEDKTILVEQLSGLHY